MTDIAPAVLEHARTVVRGWHPPTPDRIARIFSGRANSARGIYRSRDRADHPGEWVEPYRAWVDGVVDSIARTFVAKLDGPDLDLRAMLDHARAIAEVAGAIPEAVVPVFIAWDLMQEGRRGDIGPTLAEIDQHQVFDGGAMPSVEVLCWTLAEVGRRAQRPPAPTPSPAQPKRGRSTRRSRLPGGGHLVKHREAFADGMTVTTDRRFIGPRVGQPRKSAP